jgi:glycosyltransferase involved in cell wall biosynthesis
MRSRLRPATSRRRMCMAVHSPYPPDPRLAREIRVAVQDGYEVDVVAMRQPGQPMLEEIEGARVRRLPVMHRRGTTLLGAIGEYLGFTALALACIARQMLKRRYSIVQIHNPPDFLVLAGVIPRLLGSRLLLDVHDLSPDMFSMRFGTRRGAAAMERVLRVVERAAASFVDAVITVHEPYRQELIKRGTRPEKIRVVMNSYDGPIAERPIKILRNPFRIVYHGTVTPPYGTILLLDAVARVRADVPDVSLAIYGAGDALPELQRRALALDIADVVHFSGCYLPHDQVIEEVRRASVGVVPNLPIKLNHFALSSKLLEYVALGLPAVCADLPTLRAHFTNDEVLFFRAGDTASLAAALMDVAQNPDAGEARAARALQRYRHQYDWSTSAQCYANLLRDLSRDSSDVAASRAVR